MSGLQNTQAVSSLLSSVSKNDSRSDVAVDDASHLLKTAKKSGPGEVREQFDRFVAGTFFREMLKSLRSTQTENPYLGGGQTEEIFQQQLDEVLIDSFASHHGQSLSEDLFAAFHEQALAKLPKPDKLAETVQKAAATKMATLPDGSSVR